MRWNSSSTFRLLVAASLIVAAAGCPSRTGNNGGGTNGPGSGGGADTKGHAHSHEDLGPAGGHLIELGVEEYHVEWTHDDDEGLLTFIIRDKDAKAEVPIEAESLVIDMTVTDEKGQEHEETFDVPALNVQDGKTARFETKNDTLLKNLTANAKAKSILKVTIDGVPFESEIEHHAHGHSHD